MRPRAIDLFCGAGGASMGLHNAGFEVLGVDHKPQPHYPFAFTQADALDADLAGASFVWASPPCQAFTAYKRKGMGWVRNAINLIPETRAKLAAWGGLSCIENIEGAPLIDPLLLCGSMFGLPIRRHRLFELSFGLLGPPCRHDLQRRTRGYPGAANRTNERHTVEVGVWRIPLVVQREAMGTPWMTIAEMSQAIPPAYAEFIGRHAMRLLTAHK